MSEEDHIRFAQRGPLALVTLNRPEALNALTLEMCQRLEGQLADWAEDDSVQAVLIRGTGERAFCAGGDVVAIYESGRGDGKMAAEFFRAEYSLNRQVFHFPKPYIAVLDGITMGGGVGISVHGSHRIATEHTLFAMPETGIGFFPDVGGTYFLPRLAGQLGLYLGLTGQRLRAPDSLAAGIATHAMASTQLGPLEKSLVAADWSEPPDAVIASRAIDPGPVPLAPYRELIDRCFAHDSLEDILGALSAAAAAAETEAEAEVVAAAEFATETLKSLERASPTSLKLTLRQLRDGASLAFDDAMTVEYCLSQACLARHDFLEGIRATVIDKDRKPQWQPASLAEVDDEDIAAHFESLGEEDLVFG